MQPVVILIFTWNIVAAGSHNHFRPKPQHIPPYPPFLRPNPQPPLPSPQTPLAPYQPTPPAPSESPTGSPQSPAGSPPAIPTGLKFPNTRLANAYTVIQNFKDTITSDPFNVTASWVGSNICDDYRGFICDNLPTKSADVAVAGIDFNGFGLAARTLVGFIDELPDIGIFHANSNDFGGNLPLKVASLKYLFELDLSNNLFSGNFPFAVLNAGLTFLDLRYNNFVGAIPNQLFTLKLDALFLNNNFFSATLPSNLGSTTAEFITFANNMFFGAIPTSIGNLKSTLIEVLFLNNALTGCIPSEIGLLSKTTIFDASNNMLTGTLPASLACMESVQVLNFANNRLTGGVPEEVCSKLGVRNDFYSFSLSNNYLTQVGENCLKLYQKGVLDLRGNCIQNLKQQKPAMKCLGLLNGPTNINCSNRNVVPCGSRPSSPRRGLQTVVVGRRPKSSVTYAALSRVQRKM